MVGGHDQEARSVVVGVLDVRLQDLEAVEPRRQGRSDGGPGRVRMLGQLAGRQGRGQLVGGQGLKDGAGLGPALLQQGLTRQLPLQLPAGRIPRPPLQDPAPGALTIESQAGLHGGAVLQGGGQLGQQGIGIGSLPLAKQGAGLPGSGRGGPALGQGQQPAISQLLLAGIAFEQGLAQGQLQLRIPPQTPNAVQGALAAAQLGQTQGELAPLQRLQGPVAAAAGLHQQGLGPGPAGAPAGQVQAGLEAAGGGAAQV